MKIGIVKLWFVQERGKIQHKIKQEKLKSEIWKLNPKKRRKPINICWVLHIIEYIMQAHNEEECN